MTGIPKIIHYCWFGKGEKPRLVKKCIASWKKECPDFEIREWNENNFDVNCCAYVKEAYNEKKWAFVADYVRLMVLYECGGVYFDVDVELIRPIDDLLKYEAFFSSEDNKNINTGIGCGSARGNVLIKKMLDAYEGRHFVLENGLMDSTTCVVRGSSAIKKDFLDAIKDKTRVGVVNDMAYLPKDFFCPIDYKTGEMWIKDSTRGIHWFNGSWLDDGAKNQIKKEQKIRSRYPGVTGKVMAKMSQYGYKLKKYRRDGTLSTRIKGKIRGGKNG